MISLVLRIASGFVCVVAIGLAIAAASKFEAASGNTEPPDYSSLTESGFTPAEIERLAARSVDGISLVVDGIFRWVAVYQLAASVLVAFLGIAGFALADLVEDTRTMRILAYGEGKT